ncbi:gamma carbonic anhydrase family protein [Azospirillum sp. SYSU D00513]|uniref:gamma carbonic anhydrase family protein n=1 Tax=Azospirillum sp. SYSU D00513 TaxID=2812561 RepID=UPI001A964C52|nr:gamma carbonic anhydrase family protein [Azospirillum sp. SYSU D00513]
MTAFAHEGRSPRIDPTARIAPNATICGDVAIGPNCSIGFGAVIVAESGPVSIGENCVVMDTAVIRGVRGNPVRIGSNVMVGPRACLVGCTVEEEAFLATGATVFNSARIGRRAEVRINGIVHLRTVLPEGAVVPLNWIAVGDPARILPPDRHEEIWAIQKELDFPGYVFGVERPAEGGSIMPAVMPRYARALARRHAGDHAVEAANLGRIA